MTDEVKLLMQNAKCRNVEANSVRQRNATEDNGPHSVRPLQMVDIIFLGPSEFSACHSRRLTALRSSYPHTIGCKDY